MDKREKQLGLLDAIGNEGSLALAAKRCAKRDLSFPVQVKGLKGSLSSFFVALAEKEGGGDVFAVVPTQREADEVEADLQAAFGESAVVFKLPAWGTLPYRPLAKGAHVFAQRAAVLCRIACESTQVKKRIFVASQRALETPVPPKEYINTLALTVEQGMESDPQKISQALSSLGYIRVSKIAARGEFAVRGEVVDVFMAEETWAHRIVFDFDVVSRISLFDAETQVSMGATDQLVICPRKEVVWTEELAEKLLDVLEKRGEGGIENDFASYDIARKAGTTFAKMCEQNGATSNIDSIEKDTIEGTDGDGEGVFLSMTKEARGKIDTLVTELLETGESEGEELFYADLFGKPHSALEYLSPDAAVYFFGWDRLVNSEKLIENEYSSSYRTARLSLPVRPPSAMKVTLDALSSYVEQTVAFRTLEVSTEQNNEGQDAPTEGASVQNSRPLDVFKTTLQVEAESAQSFFGNVVYLKETFTSLASDGWRVFIFSDNDTQKTRIERMLEEFTSPFLTVLPFRITEGFYLPCEKIAAIQENEIFGRKKKAQKASKRVKSKPIETFVDLSPGDFVVHTNYGIGRFCGIERVKTSGTERDYIKLEYADEEFIFVPIEQVDLVQRYVGGGEAQSARLDKIGSKSWSARKARVQEKVREIAQHLIDLYSKRKASSGFPFPKDSEWTAAFEAAFPYEDTPDQYTASEDVKRDMEKPVPMDRLICGDVGFGKTEVAMRAAFKAVMGGKQVAFLSPTTVLAEQHFETCCERFKNFPVTVSLLSRFVRPAAQRKVLQELKAGKVDVLIGTHRILQNDVVFRDLGLLIVDEEQRFGVKDKEKLKTLKTNIDCLSMSATPIPRTLHMSLLKIRDMSLLMSPPQNRQPVETSVGEFDEQKIAMAIREESKRGGQVFYLHNRIETLDETKRHLERLVPEFLIETAHGKMDGDELDDVFRRFKAGGFNVLVSTTIIENGIDMPNVNTIIIDRADMYGVSQLYQLRGRVGRSDRKAYAYLFYPKGKVLSDVAMKRLEVISDFTELGSGFRIAMKDMEIRGAGNLLGKDQSGEVASVGFELYLSLLNAAIERLLNSNWRPEAEVLLELEYSGFIPDSYIDDVQTKMELYKRIASIQDENGLEDVMLEIVDRFGPMPEEVSSLLSIAEIRVICNKLSVSSLKERGSIVRIEFADVSKVNIEKVLSLLKTNANRVKLDSTHPNQLLLKTDTIDLKAKSQFIKEILEKLF